MRAFTCALACALAASAFANIQVQTGFESTETPPYVIGSLDAQNSWTAIGTNDFLVTAGAGKEGSRGVVSDSSVYSSAFAFRQIAAQTSGLVVGTVDLRYNDATPATRNDNSAFGLEAWNSSGTETYGTFMLGADGVPRLRANSVDPVFVSSLPATLPNTWYRVTLVIAPGINRTDGYIDRTWLGSVRTGSVTTLTGVTDIDLAGYGFGAVAADYGVNATNGGFNAANFDNYKLETLSLGTVRGRVNLNDYVGAVAGLPVSVEVRNSGGSVLETLTTTLNSDGEYTVAPTVRGSIQIAVKVSHWLRRAYNVALGDTGWFIGDVSLINGDVNNDNEVGPADFSALAGAFGSFLGDPTYNVNADLNGDEEVGPADFAILAGSFGEFGD